GAGRAGPALHPLQRRTACGRALPRVGAPRPERGAARHDPARRGGEPMTAAFAIREEMNDIEEAPGKVWFWELEQAVIDTGRCIQCGACIAACPSDSLGIGPEDLPKLVKMCTGCSLCWDFCPRGGLRYDAFGQAVAETPWQQNGH